MMPSLKICSVCEESVCFNTVIAVAHMQEGLWQSDEFVDDNTLTVNVSHLRQTLAGIGVEEYVSTRREASKLRLFLRERDPQAFITIVSSSEIVGRGFRGA